MGDSVFLDRQNSYLVSNRFIGHKLIRSAWILLIWRTERLNILVHVWRALMYGLTCLMSLNRMIHFQHCKQALLYSSFRLTGPVWVLTKMTVSKWKPVSCDGTSEVTCGAQHHMFPGFVEQTSAQRTAWRDEEKGPRVVHLTPHTSMPGDHMEAKQTDVMWVKAMDGTYEGCLLNAIFQALNWPGTTLQNSLCKINQDCCNLDSMMHFSIHLLVSSSSPSPPPMRSLSAACTSDPNPPYD